MAEAESNCHMIKEGGGITLQDDDELNHKDINFEPFGGGCRTKGDCLPDIERKKWQNYDMTSWIKRKFGLLREESFMVCTRGPGVVRLLDNGQRLTDPREITFSQELYGSNDFYKTTADYISQIKDTDSNFDGVLDEILDNYIKNKDRYEELAEESNLPPELIATIHYREAAKYLGTDEYFNTYLHNGDPLGQMSNNVPNPDFFSRDQFDEAALDALKGFDGESNYKENRAKELQLTNDSKDLTAMVSYAVLYNGWTLEGKTSYAYSGTDIFGEGLHTSDYNYNPDAIDLNAGAYIVLKKLLEC